jgi:hypothetical protein
MRVGRHVTGEQVELLELRSPWAAAPNGTPERTAAKLVEAFRQVVRERRELRLRFPFAEVDFVSGDELGQSCFSFAPRRRRWSTMT